MSQRYSDTQLGRLQAVNSPGSPGPSLLARDRHGPRRLATSGHSPSSSHHCQWHSPILGTEMHMRVHRVPPVETLKFLGLCLALGTFEFRRVMATIAEERDALCESASQWPQLDWDSRCNSGDVLSLRWTGVRKRIGICRSNTTKFAQEST